MSLVSLASSITRTVQRKERKDREGQRKGTRTRGRERFQIPTNRDRIAPSVSIRDPFQFSKNKAVRSSCALLFCGEIDLRFSARSGLLTDRQKVGSWDGKVKFQRPQDRPYCYGTGAVA